MPGLIDIIDEFNPAEIYSGTNGYARSGVLGPDGVWIQPHEEVARSPSDMHFDYSEQNWVHNSANTQEYTLDREESPAYSPPSPRIPSPPIHRPTRRVRFNEPSTSFSPMELCGMAEQERDYDGWSYTNRSLK